MKNMGNSLEDDNRVFENDIKRTPLDAKNKP